MVKFQRLTGARPGEVCAITPAKVDRSNAVWEIRIMEHKTAHKGKSRTVYVGPQAQAILLPYSLRGADKSCFSPIEAEKQRNEARHARRLTPPSYGKRITFGPQINCAIRWQSARQWKNDFRNAMRF